MTTLQHPRSKELEALSIKASRVFVDAGLHGIEAEVVAVLDVSPRMTPLYADGSLQTLVTALLALAMKFDDDGVVPVWTYADEARLVGKMRRTDYVSWVEQNLQPPPLLRPGMKLPPSRYAPFIDAIAQRYFPREWATPPVTRQVGGRLKRSIHEYAGLVEPRQCPIFVIVVTSGDCDDPMETSRLIRRASHLPIFWQFAAVATTEAQQRPEFRFLRGLDKLTETHVDSCGFFEASELTDPESLYRGLLGEFHGYVEHPRVREMLIELDEPVASSESSDQIAQQLLSLPAAEAAKRERARQDRERRRAAREAANVAEVARAESWPRIEVGAQRADDTPDEADDELHGEYDHEPPEPAPAPRTPTRPQPRLKPNTMQYVSRNPPPQDPEDEPEVDPEDEPDEFHSEPDDAPAAAAARPQPPPRAMATRTFQRVVTPTTPPPSENSVLLEGFDADDLEDTVETPAERLMRIRARRDARKGMSGSD